MFIPVGINRYIGDLAFLKKLSSLTFIAFAGLAFQGMAQDVIKEQLEKIEEHYFDDTSSKPSFLIYPTIAYMPETKVELGVANLFLFYAKNDKRNRLSEISSFTFFTLEKQYGVWLDHAIYTNKDKWFILGKDRYQFFPLRYHGIGNQTNRNEYAVINSYNLLIRERALRKIKGHFYLGLEIDHQNLYRVTYDDRYMPSPWQKPLGMFGSRNTGMGVGLVFDNRKNVLNVRSGKFAEIAYLGYAPFLGSDFVFHNLQYDARYFHKGFHKKQVWAFQTMGVFNFGDVPFNMLALMGGESMMRGYYLGRYRDKAMFTAQVEYRFLPFPFSKRFGGAIFTALGTVSPTPLDIRFHYIHPTAGFGARYLIFRAKDIFVRLDLAFTAEGEGYYFFIGEAF